MVRCLVIQSIDFFFCCCWRFGSVSVFPPSTQTILHAVRRDSLNGDRCECLSLNKPLRVDDLLIINRKAGRYIESNTRRKPQEKKQNTGTHNETLYKKKEKEKPNTHTQMIN